MDHPNIIKCYDYCHNYNRFIIYMEYADDGDLKQRVEEA